MRYKTVKELCRLEKGDTGITKAIPGKYPLVTTSEERKSHNDFQFDTKAVIIPLVSSTGHGHASLKRIHYQEGKFALGSILCAIIPNENLISAEFLYHYLNLNKEKELVSRMKGMANVTLSISEIGKIKIPVITLDRQIEIISLLKNVGLSVEKLNTEFEKQINFIKKLRQQILKDAIQGKLVSQNPDDEPASELLKKIKAEKERLIKEKKIKKEKPLAPILKDELPFVIPKNWKWCRLGEISYLKRGRSPKYSNTGVFKMLNQKCVRWYSIDKQHCKAIDIDWYNSTDDEFKIKQYNVLVNSTGDGTIGRSAIASKDIEGYMYDSHILNLSSSISQFFICYFLNSDFGQYLVEKTKGATSTKQTELGVNNLANFIFPLPPLAEQQRIVERVDHLMDLCNKLEESIIRNQEITERLYQSALKEALQPKETKKITLLPNYCDVPKRTILAGYILNQCHTEDFGRVKFMKLLYLVEHICYLDFNSQYIKKAAGPYDENLIREIEQKLSQMQFYQIQQDKKENKRVHYTRLGCADELDSLFTAHFVNEKEAVNELLTKFKHSTWDQCEIIATLYAVWNNRIIQNELINDALLKQDFLDWDKNKVKYKDRLDTALDWMRNNSIIPNGYGKLIEKP